MKLKVDARSHVKQLLHLQHVGIVSAALLIVMVLALLQLNQLPLFLNIHDALLECLPKSMWEEITWFGDFRVLLCLIAPLLIQRPILLVTLLLATPLASLTSIALKTWFNVRRPFEVLHPLETALFQSASNSSFPSGHSLTVVAFAAVLCALWARRLEQRWSRGLGFGFIGAMVLAVGLSRMALQAHWPLDVLAGGCVGWLVGSIACAISGAFEVQRPARFYQRISALVMCLFSLVLWYQARQDMAQVTTPLLAASSVWFYLFWKVLSGLHHRQP